jgi:hypothetical protein
MPSNATFVPLEVWHYNSPEIKRAGKRIDVGLLAEALVFYDKVYAAFSNEHQLVDLINWFRAAGAIEECIAMIQDGTLVPYYYAFHTLPAEKNGVWHVYNVQDTDSAVKPVFAERVLGSARMQGMMRKASTRARLMQGLADKHIEAKAEEYGPAIENARNDYATAERSALLVQIVIDELYRDLGFMKPPTVEATVVQDGPIQRITWNLDLANLFKRLGPDLGYHAGIPLAGAAIGSKTLWSAARLNADLWLGAPLTSYADYKLDESNKAARAQAIRQELVARAEFPDIRALVNRGTLGPKEVLELRKHAVRFREWLRSESTLDRDAVLAYLGELASKAGWRKELGVVIGAASLIGGAAIGAVLAGPLGATGGAIAGAGAQFILDIGRKLVDGWRPRVFGEWAKARIERELDEK